MNVKDLKKKSGADWERLVNMADEEIDYSDIPPLGEKFFKKGKLCIPGKRLITVPIDADMVQIADRIRNRHKFGFTHISTWPYIFRYLYMRNNSLIVNRR